LRTTSVDPALSEAASEAAFTLFTIAALQGREFKMKQGCIFSLVLGTSCILFAQSGGTAKPAESPKPDALQGSPKITTATRGVQQFWELETSLSGAFEKKDKTAIGKLLNDDFKVWMPNQTGSAVGREDWLASGHENPKPVRLVQMAVQFYQDVAVVKFVGQGKAETGSKVNPRQYFVVDLWEKNDQGWELTNRYMAAINPIQLPAKPNGKQ
jgi:hypothetical protein